MASQNVVQLWGATPEQYFPVDPQPPDTYCMFPGFRFERRRYGTFLNIARQRLRAGVYPSRLAKEGYLYTTDEWVTCFDCGLVYDLGHLDVCKAQCFSVPFGQCASAMQKELDDIDALRLSMERRIVRLREPVAVVGLDVPAVRSGVPPSCGPMDLTGVSRPPPSAGHARRNGPLERAGFQIVRRNSVRCYLCMKEIELGNWTALRHTPSLQHIEDEHRASSPMCPLSSLQNAVGAVGGWASPMPGVNN